MGVTSLFTYAFYRTKTKAHEPTKRRIVAGNSDVNRHVRAHMQSVLDEYKPTWWTNSHIQILLTFLVPQAKMRYDRQVFSLPDGGQLALDWAKDGEEHGLHDQSPVAIVLHGLTGCSEAMRSICAEALKWGYRPVVFNKRGHGGMKLSTPKFQEFGCVADLSEAIAHVQERFPQAPLYGIGFSAGSGLLTSYLGEKGSKSKLDAGVLISPGYDALDLFCNGGIHPMYDFLMTFSLKGLLMRHKEELKDVVDVQSALKAKTVKEFDQHVSMKMHGYESLESYWEKNNPMRDVDNIDRPLLCINALDDPVCSKKMIPYDTLQNISKAMLVQTEEGSHCAFYEGHLQLKSWANRAAIAYLHAVHEFQHRNVTSRLRKDTHK